MDQSLARASAPASSTYMKHLYSSTYDEYSQRNESTATDEMSEDLSSYSRHVPSIVIVKPILVRSVEQINERRRALRTERLALRAAAATTTVPATATAAAAAATTEAEESSPSLAEFTTVTIREYPLCIGDNPGAQSGVALSMEWEHVSEVTLDVSDYEDNRPPRRTGREMILPDAMRVERLRAMGYSKDEIVLWTRRMNIARGQRQRTYETLHLQPVFAWTENVARHCRNVMTLGESGRRHRQLLEQYHGLEPTPLELAAAPEPVEADLTSFKSLSGKGARRPSF